MANGKVYTAQEAAFAVLAKAQELLGKSEIGKPAKMDHEGRCEVHADKDAKSFAKSENCGVCKSEGLNKADMLHDNVAQRRQERAKGYKAHGDMVSHKIAIEGAKESHKEQLGSLKAQPKPNLPKSEDAGENEIGTKFVKAENKEAPSNPMKPKVEEKQAPQRDAKNFETQPGKSNTPPDAREASQTPPQANPKEQAEGNNPPSGAVPGKGLHKLAFFMGHTHHKRKMKKGVALG